MSPKSIAIIMSIALAIIIGSAWYLSAPARWPVEKVVGVDKYAYHTSFSGDKTITQSFTSQSDTLAGLSILIVDYKNARPAADITLTLAEQDSDQPIRTSTVSGQAVKDDYYLPFMFEPVPNTRGKAYTLTLAAPAADSDAPYAVRYTEDKQSIAFSYDRSVTRLFIAKQWVKDHGTELTAVTFLAVSTTALAFLLPWANRKTKRWLIALSIILAVGTYLQIQIIRQLTGAVGGDAYYYLVAAKQITEGQNPLSDWSFRLPFYPLLLTPATLPAIPDLLWGRILGIAITIGMGFGLILIAKPLHLRPIVAVAAMALLYINTDFLITALRPRPYTLFALQLLTATAALFYIKTVRHALLWGIFLGIMGMTRQEAYLPTAILGISFAIQLYAQKKPLTEIAKYLAAAAIPLFLIISPYFYANWRDNGSPISTTAYTSRDDLHFPKDFQSFWSGNLTRARDAIGSVWLPASQPGIRAHASPQFIGLLGIGLALYLAARSQLIRKRIKQLPHLNTALFSLASLASGILLALIYRWQLYTKDNWAQDINLILMAMLLIGLIEIVRVGRWRGFLVVLILASQFLIATLFHPAPKHYQQTYPYFALAIAAALLPFGGIQTVRKQTTRPHLASQALLAAPIILLVGFLGANNIIHIENAIDSHNYPAAAYYVTTSAAEELEKYPSGNTAAEVDYTKGDGIYRLHTYQQRSLIRHQEPMSITQQLAWLCQNNITYILDHNELETLTIQTNPAYASNFSHLFEKKANSRNDRKFQVTAYMFSQALCHE